MAVRPLDRFGQEIPMTHATLNMNGKTFVLVPQVEYRRMTAARRHA